MSDIVAITMDGNDWGCSRHTKAIFADHFCELGLSNQIFAIGKVLKAKKIHGKGSLYSFCAHFVLIEPVMSKTAQSGNIILLDFPLSSLPFFEGPDKGLPKKIQRRIR